MANHKVATSEPQAVFLGVFAGGDTVENLLKNPIEITPVDASTLKLDRTKSVTIPAGQSAPLTEGGTYFITKGHNTTSTVPQPFIVTA